MVVSRGQRPHWQYLQRHLLQFLCLCLLVYRRRRQRQPQARPLRGGLLVRRRWRLRLYLGVRQRPRLLAR
jgi:hypothetical protein